MAVWKINNIFCWQHAAKCHSETTKGTNNKRNLKPKHAHTHTATETHSSYKRYRSVKQDYPAAGEQDDALKIPQTAQQSVAALNLSYVNLYVSAARWYRLNTHFPRTSSIGCAPCPSPSLSLPEILRSSSWRLPWAEPRTRCGWDWWAPVQPLPSRLWPKAGTRDSTAPTGSRPHRPDEPRDTLQRTGKERANSSFQRSRPHPAGLGDPSEEPAYSLEGARSSGPAWHIQVLKKCGFCLVYFLFSSW